MIQNYKLVESSLVECSDLKEVYRLNVLNLDEIIE